jgi:hypothetical protein
MARMETVNFIEMTDMLVVYGEAGCNGRRAARLYEDRYPLRHHPHHTTFASIYRRLRQTGNLKRPGGAGRPRTARTPEFEEDVLRHAGQDASTSVRAIAHHMTAAKSSVWRVLKEQQLYPYHVQKVQAIGPADYQPRMTFCQWFVGRNLVQPDFSRNVMFTDEACFTRDGFFNSHNSHIWEVENPHANTLRKNQHQFSINIWAGIVGENVIGPYLLPPRLNGHLYLEFLQHVLPELLQDVPLDIRRDMWLQHDGAPAHFSLRVREYLNDQFPNRWIGRGGPVSWPARSPDLSALDFFLWGYVKSLVYETPVRGEEDLLARVMAACTHVQGIPGIFHRVRESIDRRYHLCIETNGRHFEHLL